MNFIGLIIFILIIVGRALGETKRKQGQYQRNKPQRPADPGGRPLESPKMPRLPWDLEEEPLPPVEAEREYRRSAVPQNNIPRMQEVCLPEGEGTEGKELRPQGDFMAGMGAEGSRSSEGPKAKSRKKKVIKNGQTVPAYREQRLGGVLDLHDVARGLVMAEILGPPRSKRPFK